MHETRPFVSILVVNYNGRRFLPDLFHSLDQIDYPSERHEVLLVDNGSTDDSVDYVRGHWPRVRLIEAGENLGFAAGNNLGFLQARGDFIALLNNDTTVDAHWLAELVRTLERDPSLGSATSKIVFMHDPGLIHNVGMELYRDGKSLNRGYLQRDDGRFDEEVDVFAGCGASALLRRSMLEDVGPFDESFFMYYEDLDLAWRGQLRGWGCRYSPRSVVRHVHCGTSEQGSPFFVFHVLRNVIFTNLKNGRWPAVLGCVRTLAKSTFWAAGRVVWRREGWQVLRAHVEVWFSLAGNTPQLLRKRRQIRGVTRKVSDRQIEERMSPH